MFAEQVLHAPETAGRDGAFLRVGREVLRRGFGVEGEVGGGREGPEEPVQEGHRAGHQDGEDAEDESGGGELQGGGCGGGRLFGGFVDGGRGIWVFWSMGGYNG